MLVIIVAPVVVNPDTDSNIAFVIDIFRESLSNIGKDAKVLNTNQNNTTIIKPSRNFRSVLACIAGSHSNSPETKIKINA